MEEDDDDPPSDELGEAFGFQGGGFSLTIAERERAKMEEDDDDPPSDELGEAFGF